MKSCKAAQKFLFILMSSGNAYGSGKLLTSFPGFIHCTLFKSAPRVKNARALLSFACFWLSAWFYSI